MDGLILVQQHRREEEKRGLQFYFFLPVLLAAIFPTFRPGGACLLTVVGLPGD